MSKRKRVQQTGRDWLADFHRKGGVKQLPKRPCPDERFRSLVPFEKLEHCLSDPRQLLPSDRADAEQIAERRRITIEWIRHRLVAAIGCEKTFEVMMQLSDGLVRPADIARVLGCHASTIIREIRQILDSCRDNWPTHPHEK